MARSKKERLFLSNKDRDKTKHTLSSDDKFLAEQWLKKLNEVCENPNSRGESKGI